MIDSSAGTNTRVLAIDAGLRAEESQIVDIDEDHLVVHAGTNLDRVARAGGGLRSTDRRESRTQSIAVRGTRESIIIDHKHRCRSWLHSNDDHTQTGEHQKTPCQSFETIAYGLSLRRSRRIALTHGCDLSAPVMQRGPHPAIGSSPISIDDGPSRRKRRVTLSKGRAPRLARLVHVAAASDTSGRAGPVIRSKWRCCSEKLSATAHQSGAVVSPERGVISREEGGVHARMLAPRLWRACQSAADKTGGAGHGARNSPASTPSRFTSGAGSSK